MASKSIDIVISTILKKTGIDAARAQMKHLAQTVGKNLQNIRAGFEMAGVAIGKFVSAMSKGMEFERMTVQFKSLTGSMETAKAHMKDLQDLGRTPPFSLEEFAAASRAMMKMTDGMAGYKKEMEIVGDLAAATGNDIATVGRAFGLAYQVIRDGQDFGRAGQQLYSLGIMTKKQVAEFDELSKAGTDNAAVWEKLQEVFGRYKGAMAETEKTTKGLVEAIQGEATVAITDLSSAIAEEAKPMLEQLLSWMKKINEDGTIEDWADDVVEAMRSVAEAVSVVSDKLAGIWSATKAVVGSAVGAVAGTVTTMTNGGSVSDALKVGAQTAKQSWNDAMGGNETEREAKEDRKRKRAEDKARRKEETSAKLAEESEKKKAEDMARAKSEKQKELAKKEEEDRLKAVEAERKAREKMEADLHKQRVDNLNAEIKAQQTKAASTESVAQAAQTEFDKAFAMYRSEDKGAAAIAEERDYAKDYKQLQKDASRYGGKWRIDELSALMAAGDTRGQAAKLEEWRKSSSFTPEVESMVRAAAADNTRTTAEDELRQINANTAALSEKLDELLRVK